MVTEYQKVLKEIRKKKAEISKRKEKIEKAKKLTEAKAELRKLKYGKYVAAGRRIFEYARKVTTPTPIPKRRKGPIMETREETYAERLNKALSQI